MMSVVEMFGEASQFCPTPDLQAAYLEWLARQIRSGAMQMDRAVVLLQPTTGDIVYLPFGGPCDTMQMVGLIEMGKMKAALDFAKQP